MYWPATFPQFQSDYSSTLSPLLAQLSHALSLFSQMGYVGRILSVIYTFVLCTLIAGSYAWNITTVFGNDTAQVASCIVVIIPYIFLIILCSPLPCIRIPEEEQLSIQTFHINQGFIAVTSVIANVLLPVVMLLGPKNVSSVCFGNFFFIYFYL